MALNRVTLAGTIEVLQKDWHSVQSLCRELGLSRQAVYTRLAKVRLSEYVLLERVSRTTHKRGPSLREYRVEVKL